jgi:gag-polypeptide of LTR copia-type
MYFSAKNIDLTVDINSILLLTGSNYKEWKYTLQIILGCLDLDIVLQKPKPHVHTADSPEKVQNAHALWMRSNRLCLKVMQMIILESFRGPIFDFTLALDYLKELEKMFVRNKRAKIGILLNKLCTMKYNDRSNVREHILKMILKLKAHKLDISEDMIVYLSLNSLPTSFGQFKVSYNRQKESYIVNELISHCVQEEERLKMDKSESANITSTSKRRGKQKCKVNSDAATISS